MNPKTEKQPVEKPVKYSAECGATHNDCPNTWKGTCDRAAGHDGSHHCSSCNSVF
jgi:hypothetical protein